MLSGEGNAGERLKTTIGLIRKTQLSTCNTLFWYISLPLFCTVKLLETSEFYVLWRKCRTCSRSLVFHCSSFSPCIGGRYHFSFCHLRYKMFMLFFRQKNVSFVFQLPLQISDALSLVELRWLASLFSLFLCLSPALYSKFVDLTINLSLILKKKHGYRNIFRFPFSSLLTLQLCLLHKTLVAIRFPAKIT